MIDMIMRYEKRFQGVVEIRPGLEEFLEIFSEGFSVGFITSGIDKDGSARELEQRRIALPYIDEMSAHSRRLGRQRSEGKKRYEED